MNAPATMSEVAEAFLAGTAVGVLAGAGFVWFCWWLNSQRSKP